MYMYSTLCTCNNYYTHVHCATQYYYCKPLKPNSKSTRAYTIYIHVHTCTVLSSKGVDCLWCTTSKFIFWPCPFPTLKVNTRMYIIGEIHDCILFTCLHYALYKEWVYSCLHVYSTKVNLVLTYWIYKYLHVHIRGIITSP